MLMLKSCPRCGGDLVLETQLDRTELFCLQCAHRLATGSAASGLRRLPSEDRRAPSRGLPTPAATGT
jgi:hypothetical protein